jgi:C1A family cysteine protease
MQMCGLLPGVYDPASVPGEAEITEPMAFRGYETPHTSIKDQGSCGSCYAFGACATYEGFRKKKTGETTDLSEQYFMMKAKAIGPYGGCQGWYLDTSMNLLKNYGVPAESCCPYKAYETACPSTCTGTYKITSFAGTSTQSGIKNGLNYGPVYVGFAVYTDFSSYTSGYYAYTSGSLRGYHAVAVVGYDDIGFKVKNSWGTGWGESGYFRILYSQMTNSVQFGTCFGGSFYINAD